MNSKCENSFIFSSRSSLTGSRQSLSGSRTQLATFSDRSAHVSHNVSDIPKKYDRRSVATTSETSSASKPESFVETGFLETLRPQFTPGQPITSPSLTIQHSIEEKLNVLQVQQENDDLRSQIYDLTEKLETLKQRRNEDKERFREYDKIKTQFEQLQEFKIRIMEAQSQLQRKYIDSRYHFTI